MSEQWKYDKLYKNDLMYAGTKQLYGSGFHAEPVMPLIRSLKLDSVLDIGCGRGQLLMQLQKEGARNLFGCDISAVLINNLRQQQEMKGITLKCGPMHKLPVVGSFTLVTAFDVLEHIPEELLDDSISELMRVMGPGGDAVVSVAWHPSGKEWGMELHVNVKPRDWWMQKLRHYFDEVEIVKMKPKGMFVHLRIWE